MMSSASIRSRFEQAYSERAAAQASKGANVPQPENASYKQAYYQDKINSMGKGYVHPYHTQANPLVYTHFNYMRTLFEAVGPEQVSPHYESLSRSRRGLIFLFFYIGSITSLSRLGGWSHNEWIRGMLFHHEFLLTWYIGFIESRHFTFIIGPKFSIFYNVYSRYELQQMGNQWVDHVEEVQADHLVETKEQMEYVRVNKEYEFVKKRALVNFLTNSRSTLETHVHNRAANMLASIESFEAANLKGLLNGIGAAAVEKMQAALNDPEAMKEINEAAFQSALKGIASGSMTYQGDPLLPILQNEVEARTNAYANISAAEESKLMSLTADHRRIIAENDRKAKQEFLQKLPSVSNPGVRMHPKYQAFASQIGGH